MEELHRKINLCSDSTKPMTTSKSNRNQSGNRVKLASALLYHSYCYIDDSVNMIIQFRLLVCTWNFHSSDINECDSENGDCEHICHNTEGSFYCTCHSGYQLNSDERTCTGNTLCGYISLNSSYTIVQVQQPSLLC